MTRHRFSLILLLVGLGTLAGEYANQLDQGMEDAAGELWAKFAGAATLTGVVTGAAWMIFFIRGARGGQRSPRPSVTRAGWVLVAAAPAVGVWIVALIHDPHVMAVLYGSLAGGLLVSSAAVFVVERRRSRAREPKPD